MADRYGEFLKILDDPQHFVKVADVPVFDAHREVYFVDDKGKLCSAKSPKAKKVVKDFDKQELRKIASNCNERDSTGTLAPLTKGHTIPDEDDESRQPEILGYAKNYRVRWDHRLKKWVIAADYFIRTDAEKEARSFPRTSVELWPGDDVIDPIALLRRTPARDLGQWTYSADKSSPKLRAAGETAWRFSRAGRPVLRYTLETQPMAEPWEDDADMTPPAGGDPAGAPFGEEDNGDDAPKAMEFMKHCMSHPHAMHFAKKYSMDAGLPGKAGPGSEDEALAGDPTAPPDAETPMMNDKGKKTPTKGPDRYRKGGEANALEEAKQREAEAEARNWVMRLADIEHLDLNEETETLRFAKAYRHSGVEGCGKLAAHLRRYHKQKIDAPVGRIPLAKNPRKGAETFSDHERVLHYQKQHPELDWDEAEAAVRSGKK